MKHLPHSILILICLTVLSASFVVGQDSQQQLLPKNPITFSLSPSEMESFTLQMREDDFAEIIWLANDSLIINFKIYNLNGKELYQGNSVDNESLLFVGKQGKEIFKKDFKEKIAESPFWQMIQEDKNNK